MFRDLIPLLADRFHLAAPDLPGFGRSDMPGRGLTFDSRLRIHHKSWSDWVLWITRTMIGTERSNCMRWQDHVILEQFPALSVPKVPTIQVRAGWGRDGRRSDGDERIAEDARRRMAEGVQRTAVRHPARCSLP